MMTKFTKQHKSITLKTVIHLISLWLLISFYYQAINDTLGADPVEEILHFTGIGALNLLLLGLAVTPMVKAFKIPWLMQSRRLIGLYAFTYAFCHVMSFWAFEIQFDVVLFVDEIIERPYITVGMSAFIILIPLAITSWSHIKKRMGKNWQRLHNWVYLAIALAAIHFYWSVKSDITEPAIYLLIFGILMYVRRRKWR